MGTNPHTENPTPLEEVEEVEVIEPASEEEPEIEQE